jgi:hypothetical protein
MCNGEISQQTHIRNNNIIYVLLYFYIKPDDDRFAPKHVACREQTAMHNTHRLALFDGNLIH